MLLLLLVTIVVVKIATSKFYPKQSKKIRMDEIRTKKLFKHKMNVASKQ